MKASSASFQAAVLFVVAGMIWGSIVQVWIWIAGTVILTIGVGLVHTGHAIGDPIAAIGSIIVLADMLLFGWDDGTTRTNLDGIASEHRPAE